MAVNSSLSNSSELNPERLKLFMMLNTFETGGSERQFIAVTQAIDRRHFDLRFGCVARVGPLLDPSATVAEFSLGGSFLSFRAQRSRMALARHLRSEEIQIAHSFDFYTNLLLLPTARLAGVRAVIGSQRQLGDLLTPLQARAQALAFRFSHRVVCNSRAAAERLRRDGLPDEKIVIIPNGLSDELFTRASPAISIVPGTIRIGMIARMNSRAKNHRVFLKAAARLSSRFSHLEFLLVGDGPLRLELEQYATQLGIRNRVVFLGDRRDIPEILASTDISVVPSESESQSNAVLESMAAGIAVVATNVGGTPELITNEESGLLVAAHREEDLAQAIERFVTDPAFRAACASKARETVARHFSLTNVVRRYELLYEELLTHRRKRHRDSPTKQPSGRQNHSETVQVSIIGPSDRYVGGQSVQLNMLLRKWRNDPEIEARFIAVDPDPPRLLKWANHVPVLRTLIREPLYWNALRTKLKEAQIVHVFSASYWSFLLAPAPAYWAARAQGKKVLIHYHSGEAPDHLRRSRIARRILKSADCVVVPSGYLSSEFGKFGIQAKPIANVVDTTEFSFRLRSPLRPYLICSRGFHPYYAVEDVVRAFSSVQAQYPDAVLYLVGSGPNEREIRELVSALRLSNVEFTGPVAHARIAAYYDRADIFLNASRLDNMPVSILEAFASGTPVVTTAAGGIPWLVKHNCTGLMCEPGSWALLAEYAVQLLRDPVLAVQLAANAREELKKYEWESVREEWLATYRSLTGYPIPSHSDRELAGEQT